MKRRLGQLPGWQLALLALALASIVPLWVVRHLPLQDLPQHLAAMRVLHDYHEPSLGFDRYFERSLGRTQYLAYYLVVDVLAYPFGVSIANKIVLSLCLIALPFALGRLLRSLDRDRAYAVLSLPLVYNAHLILGFFNFVAATPLMLWGLSLAVDQRRRPNRRRAVLLSVVTLITFFTHVVPCAFLIAGAALVLLGREPRAALSAAWPLAPTLLAGLIWSQTTPAGHAVLAASGAVPAAARAQFEPWGQALRQIPDWLTDVLQGPADDELLVVFLLVLLGVLLAGSLEPAPRDRDPLVRSLTLRIAVLCPVAAVLYFVAPSSYDWIWPINARFPWLALVLLLPVLPDLQGRARCVAVASAAVIGLFSFVKVADAFRGFERVELAGFESVSRAIPEGSRVAGLIWDRGSRYVKFSPLIHAAALHQAERGGAAMFSFADFPQSPIRFKQDARPPRVPPRWEWLPQQVDPDRQLDWYEYVLVRGGPGRIERSRRWKLLIRDRGWAVYRRAEAVAQPPM